MHFRKASFYKYTAGHLKKPRNDMPRRGKIKGPAVAKRKLSVVGNEILQRRETTCLDAAKRHAPARRNEKSRRSETRTRFLAIRIIISFRAEN